MCKEELDWNSFRSTVPALSVNGNDVWHSARLYPGFLTLALIPLWPALVPNFSEGLCHPLFSKSATSGSSLSSWERSRHIPTSEFAWDRVKPGVLFFLCLPWEDLQYWGTMLILTLKKLDKSHQKAGFCPGMGYSWPHSWRRCIENT